MLGISNDIRFIEEEARDEDDVIWATTLFGQLGGLSGGKISSDKRFE